MMNELPPGAELDELIIRHVFGATDPRPNFTPSYSTKIKSAWEIVERMLLEGWCYELTGWQDHTAIFIGSDGRRVVATANTPQHAICLAALDIMGNETC